MKNINIINLLCSTILFCIFIVPVDLLNKYFPVDKYIFLATVLMTYFFIIIKSGKIKMFDFAIFIISIFFCILKRDVSYLHLLGIGLANRLFENKRLLVDIKTYCLTSNFIFICLFFVFIYSIIYFGHDGRYLNTGLVDPNTSGLAIFSLFTIIRCRSKKLGNLLLIFGLLTLSKSYLLAIIIYCFVKFLFYKKRHMVKINYCFLSCVSIVFLLILSSLFIYMEQENKIRSYQYGINRFVVFFDYSNYHRFTVNTNLLAIYNENKELLMTGIDEEQFYNLNANYTHRNGRIFYRIRPHNYFFSYFRIYGLWSILIFVLTYQSIKKVLNYSNNMISLPIFFYLVFLGLGLNSYWLYLTSFTLITNSEEIK